MIEAAIRNLIPHDNEKAESWRQYLLEACHSFISSGLCDSKFEAELKCSEEGKIWSCLSEALVYLLLKQLEFPPRENLGAGPDFLVSDGEQRIWIEVVCPEPSGVPKEWLNCTLGRAVSVPHKEILLRWTSAIKAKAEKFEKYLSSGVVSKEDALVIAVNGCRLRNGPFSSIVGISQHPVAAEVLFGFGPYQLHIDRQTLETVAGDHSYRPKVENQNGASIAADAFMGERFKFISGVWALDINGHSAFGGNEEKYVIHNPYAVNPLRRKFLQSDGEYVAEKVGDIYSILRISGFEA